jgi:hypothetical protein
VLTWGGDFGGFVTSWEGGKLEKELHGIEVSLSPPALDAKGEYVLPGFTSQEVDVISISNEYSSTHPALQKLNPRVSSLVMNF